MLPKHVIQTCIDSLHEITRTDLFVTDAGGILLAAASAGQAEPGSCGAFINSPADAQVIGNDHLFKVLSEDDALLYVVCVQGPAETAHMTGRICTDQLRALITAYRERLDKGGFFQNLLLDNMLLVDVYNRARHLHIAQEEPRAVLVVETEPRADELAAELLRGMFTPRSGDYVTAVDQASLLVIKSVPPGDAEELLHDTASSIVEMMNMEAMRNARVAYGTVATDLKDLSRSFKEATMAMEVGRIFYEEQHVNSYAALGIGRLIYQLPESLCRMYLKEVFPQGAPFRALDDEMLTTANEFFKNSLNVSETARKLFVHRNTLVYRLEKLSREIGLDIRSFDDAMTFKIAFMVARYMHYLDSR